jgi:hypothetical protein
MKRTILVLAVIIAILLSAMLQVQPPAKANPYSGPGPPSINITYSPDFLTNSVMLKIDVTVWRDITDCTREAWYSLDGQKNVSIPLTFKGIINEGGYQFSEVSGETRMPIWSQGPHTLNVTVVYTQGYYILTAGSKTLYIGQPEPTPTPPILTVISPRNQTTYHNNQVPIVYNLNLKVVWSYYALDTVGRPEVSDWKVFTGNFTLSGLATGSHRIIISVKAETDFVPSFTEKTIDFKVDSSDEPSNDSSVLSSDSSSSSTPSQNSSTSTDSSSPSNSSTNPVQLSLLEPFPTAAIAIASAASFVIVGLSVLIYLKKGKRGVASP